MPHGKKPTSHKKKLLNPTAFVEYLGLRGGAYHAQHQKGREARTATRRL